MEEEIVVYKHTSPSNKVYIGQTKNYKKRCVPGNYKSSPYFYHAIQKYGWENFTHEILGVCSSQEEADKSEINYIKQYNSTNPKYGYNICKGGGHKAIMEGKNNPFYGKTHSKETKQKLSEMHRHMNTKQVECINTGEIFESARFAAEWCGITKQGIQRCCSGGRPTAGKHPITNEKLKWRYFNEI